MVPNHLQEKFLKCMLKRHKMLEQYGPKALEASKLLLSSSREIEQEVPALLVERDGEGKKFLVSDVVSELERKGYVELNKAGAFWLTEAGYRQARQGWIQRSIARVNQKPGLSISLSVSAIVGSIVSLFLRCHS